MNVRQKRIVRLSLLYLQMWWEEALDQFEAEFPNLPRGFPYDPARMVSVGSQTFFPPTDEEMRLIVEKGTGGNWRTKELLLLALAFTQNNIDELENEFYPDSDTEFDEPRLKIESENGSTVLLKMPTTEEFDVLIDSITEIAKYFPPVQLAAQRAWEVYDYVEDETGVYHWQEIDTVFYNRDCDADYVRNGLVNHDGYNPGIVVLAESSK
jgi:hypothetical protein